MSIENVKADLRELMKLTRKQGLPSANAIAIPVTIAYPGADVWGEYVAPADGYVSIHGGQRSGLDIRYGRISTCCWTQDSSPLITSAWAPVRAGDRVAYHLIKHDRSDTDVEGFFIPCVGAV